MPTCTTKRTLLRFFCAPRMVNKTCCGYEWKPTGPGEAPLYSWHPGNKKGGWARRMARHGSCAKSTSRQAVCFDCPGSASAPTVHSFPQQYHRVAFRRRLALSPNDHRLRWATRHKGRYHHYSCCPASFLVVSSFFSQSPLTRSDEDDLKAKAKSMTPCRATPAAAHARPCNTHTTMCECHRHVLV
ncbi:hypothetical protein V8C26DRAFT_390132 [Trichoderma gracile]